jgi:hypothetical protein
VPSRSRWTVVRLGSALSPSRRSNRLSWPRWHV